MDGVRKGMLIMVGWEILSYFTIFGDWVIKTKWDLVILGGNYETWKKYDLFPDYSFNTFPFNQQIQMQDH